MKKLIISILLILLPVFLSAQAMLYGVAAEIETLLNEPAVTCDQAAKFVLNSAGAEYQGGAFEYAASKGWLKKAAANDRITMGQLSFLIMKTFDLRAGIMYAIFPGQRYAYRSMVSRSFIQGICDPAMTVSGENFLLILGKVLSAQGGEQ